MAENIVIEELLYHPCYVRRYTIGGEQRINVDLL